MRGDRKTSSSARAIIGSGWVEAYCSHWVCFQ
jgi:hypothetical protein